MNSRKLKGQYFEIDALIAIGLLIIGLIYVRSLTVQQPLLEQNEEYSQQAAALLRSMKVGDLDESFINYLENSSLGKYTSRNFSIAKQIGIYLFEKNQTLAENLTRYVLDPLIPIDYGYGVWIRDINNESIIYARNSSKAFRNLAVSKTMITGLQQDKPTIGKLARLYLGNVEDLQREYMFFGGFIGQGNISFNIKLPQNSEVTNVYFEGFVGAKINVSVNNVSCGWIEKTQELTNITQASLDNCINRFSETKNNVLFEFVDGSISDHYIGGGFFEVAYKIRESPSQQLKNKKELPGIMGIVNIYDSLFFNGNLTNITTHIYFNKTDNSRIALTIGNSTKWETIEPGNYLLELSKDNFSQSEFQDYSFKNVPFRFGTKGEKGSADVVWITDRSDSMEECGDIENDYELEERGCGLYDDLENRSGNEWISKGWVLYQYSDGYTSPKGEFCVDNAYLVRFDHYENFTLILDYNFVEMPLSNEPLKIALHYEGDWDYYIAINNNQQKIKLVWPTGSREEIIPDYKNQSTVKWKHYGGKSEIYFDNKLVINQTHETILTEFIVLLTEPNTFVCMDKLRFYDESASTIKEFGYGNYYSQSEEGNYYEKIKPEKIPLAKSQVSSCSGNDDICYCDSAGDWISGQTCKLGYYPWNDCCNTSTCCQDIYSGQECYKALWFAGESTGEFQCTKSYWLTKNATTPVIGECLTLCDLYGEYRLGNCSSEKKYNCSYDSSHGIFDKYCTDINHFDDGLHTAPLCYEETQSLVAFLDRDISEMDFTTNCVSPIPEPPDPVPMLEACDGNCISSSYKKCEIYYTPIGDWKQNCNQIQGEACYCFAGRPPEEDCHDYDLQFDRYRLYHKNCSATHGQIYWVGYRYRAPGNCYNYTSWEYQCRNQISEGLIKDNIYTGNFPYFSDTSNNYYKTGFFKTNFSVNLPVNEVKVTLNFSDDIIHCYLNNKPIVFYPSFFPNSEPDRIYNVSKSFLVNGINNISCEFKNIKGLGGYNLSLFVDGQRLINESYHKWWYYEDRTDFCSNSTSIFNWGCEFQKILDSCENKPPLYIRNNTNRKKLAYALYNPDSLEYEYFNKVVEELSVMLGGLQVERFDVKDKIPKEFWDSGDVLILDSNGNCTIAEQWNSSYSKNISLAVTQGKSILTSLITGTYGGFVGTSKASYGFSSFVYTNGSGEVVLPQSEYVCGLRDYWTSIGVSSESGYYEEWLMNIAAHYFTIFFPVWNSSTYDNLICPYSEYCMPGDESHCEVCDYIRMRLAKKLNKKYTSDLLEAEGNKLSLIGFGRNLSCAPQITNLTDNLSMIQSAIEQYEADCGETCTGCALYQSMQTFESRFPPLNISSELYTKLVGWWNMDNDTIVEDISGNGYIGVAGNGVTYTSDGKFGGAYNFNGSGYITVDPGLSSVMDKTNWTVSLWIYPDDMSSGRGLFSQGHTDTGVGDRDGSLVFLTQSAGKYKPYFIFGDETYIAPYNITSQRWLHIVAMVNQTKMSIYINGQFIGSKNKGQNALSIGEPFLIGTKKFDDGGDISYTNWIGKIDEVLLWNRTLSESEIQEIYNSGQNETRKKYVVLMSDGEANYAWNNTHSYLSLADAKSQALLFSEQLCTFYNATLITVAFGSLEGSATLQEMAQANYNAGCNGTYFEGTNEQELDEAFNRIVRLINFNLQSINRTVFLTNNTLSSESYIEYEFNVTNSSQEIPPDTIRLMTKTTRFGELNPIDPCLPAEINLEGFSMIEIAEITSYSGEYWTSKVSVNDIDIFNLKKYGTKFTLLGDPFVIEIPSSDLGSKKFNIKMNVSSELTMGECSPYNRMLYTAYLPNTYTIYSDVLREAEGCIWEIGFSDGSGQTIKVPSDYEGDRTCKYNDTVDYNPNNAVDIVMFRLLDILDVTGENKKIEINFDQDDIQVDVETVEKIPYLWGPAILDVRVWK